MHYKGDPWKSPLICINFDHWSPQKWVRKFNDPYKMPQNATKSHHKIGWNLKIPKKMVETAKKSPNNCTCHRFAPVALGFDHPKLQPHLHRYGDQTWRRHTATAGEDAGRGLRRGGKGETWQGFGRWLFVGRICWMERFHGEVGDPIIVVVLFFQFFEHLVATPKSVGLRKSATVDFGCCWQLKWVFSKYLGIFVAECFSSSRLVPHLGDFSPTGTVVQNTAISAFIFSSSLKTADKNVMIGHMCANATSIRLHSQPPPKKKKDKVLRCLKNISAIDPHVMLRATSGNWLRNQGITWDSHDILISKVAKHIAKHIQFDVRNPTFFNRISNEVHMSHIGKKQTP